MASTHKDILVYADWQGIDKPSLVGTLAADVVKGIEIFSFEYTTEWLQSKHAMSLDPDLQLYGGRQYIRDEKPNFGLFMDSSPDRWGRVLMKRREALIARQEERRPLTLLGSDFLLGVYDGNRMGGLRFKLEQDGPFLGHEQALAAPPWVRLRELENASLQLEKDHVEDKNEELKWLNLLMAPGASLGGARPKASVTGPDGSLWIAKFPSINDEADTGAWEMVVSDLAAKVEIATAPAMIRKFSGKHHTFLSKRFDRTADQQRVHFASAMTLLGYQDGVDAQEGVSYLEIVEFIQRSGTNPTQNLKELWKRILFNVLVKNTDDHLRNHGFILEGTGWTLSPAYDMNPVPRGTGLTLNISEDDNALDTDLVQSVAPYFRVSKEEAKELISSFRKIISGWGTVADQYHLSRGEKEAMADAFEHGG
jgi:serine/threonine-protein kinase HipA